MQHLIDMAIVQARKQLPHVTLNLWHSKPHSWPISKTSEVMIHILEDHVNAPLVLVTIDLLPLLISLWAWGGDNLLELDDVLVVKLLQDLDLAYSSNWEAFPLVVHSDLLKRHDLVGARLLGHVDLPIGALADLLELLKAVDAAGTP